MRLNRRTDAGPRRLARQPGRGPATCLAGAVLGLGALVGAAACSGDTSVAPRVSPGSTSTSPVGVPATTSPPTGSPTTGSPTVTDVPTAPAPGVPGPPTTSPATSTPVVGPSTTPVPRPSPTGSTSPTGPTGAPSEPPGSAPPDGAGATLVAYYGTGGTDALGILGQGSPAEAFAAVTKRAKAYDRPGLPAEPVFELITTVASSTPGKGGLYRNRIEPDVIDDYLAAARARGGRIILDIQPGRADFLTEAKALQRWLEQPDVGLALDPEWRMRSGQVPGKVIGSVDVEEINEVSSWLDQLVAARGLPPKLFVVHKFTNSMIRGERRLADRARLREVINVDGFGSQAEKLEKYRAFAKTSPWPLGLKLFTKKRNDPDLFTPDEVLALQPRPVLVNYQ